MINSATHTISKTIDTPLFPNHIDWKDTVDNITKLALSALKLLYYVAIAVLAFPLSFTHPYQYASITDNVRKTISELALRPQREKQKTYSSPRMIEKIQNHSGKAFIFLGVGVAMLGWLYFHPQTPKLPLDLNLQSEPSSNAFSYWPLLPVLGLVAVMTRYYRRSLSHDKTGSIPEKNLFDFLIPNLIEHSEEAQQYIKNTKKCAELGDQKKRLEKVMLFAQFKDFSKINETLIPIRKELDNLEKYFTADRINQVISTLEKEIYAILKSPWSFPGLAEILATKKFEIPYQQYSEEKKKNIHQAFLGQKLKKVSFTRDVIEHDVNKIIGLKAIITQQLNILCGPDESPRN